MLRHSMVAPLDWQVGQRLLRLVDEARVMKSLRHHSLLVDLQPRLKAAYEELGVVFLVGLSQLEVARMGPPLALQVQV